MEETTFLPGKVRAIDCNKEEVTITDGVLAAVPGVTYTYEITVLNDAQYGLGVQGASENGAVVTVRIADEESVSFATGTTEGMVNSAKPVSLTAGTYSMEVTVSEECVLRAIMAEVYDDTEGRLLIVESTGGDAKNAKRAVDRKASSAWEPDSSNPTLTLDLGEIAYADYFVLTGDLTKVSACRLEVSEDGNNWTTVYSTYYVPASGSKVYFQGTEVYKGSKWRFSFTGTVIKLNEVELHTYMNWTMEAEKSYTTGGNNPDRPSSNPAKTADGNRIGHPKNQNGFIADVGSNMTINFTKAYPMTGVILSGMQLSVDENSDGEIPDDVMTSDRAPASYTISYQKEDGEWVNLGTLDTAQKVLTYFEFDEGNEVMVQAVKIHIDGWARLMEAEAVQMINYTLNGVAKTE